MTTIKEDIKIINELLGKKQIIKKYLYFLFGVFLLSISYNLFILPNDLVYGGVSGIAILTKHIIDPSLFILMVNIVLLILSFLILGKNKTLGSIVGALLFPIFVKLTSNIGSFIVIEDADLFLKVIVAGFLSGTASGIILKYGFSTGGTDISAQILSKIFKISLGKALIISDALIISAATIYLGPVKVMYAIILLYIFSVMVDKVILGISDNKAFYIITSKEEEIKEYILSSLNKGVTVLKAKGGFSGSSTNILLCVVPTRHYFKLKEGINAIDENAFLVISDAYEVKGGT